MARGRMISKTLSTSVCFARLFDRCADLAEFTQSLYPLLVAHADDFGREQGDVLTVKYRIHPRSPRTEDEFAAAMVALDDVGLIHWYEVRGRRCYQVCKFDDHQNGLHKRTRSQFPAFPGISGKAPDIPAQLKGTEENRTELNRREQNKSVSDAPLRDASPVVLTFATVGKAKHFELRERQIGEWDASYPTIDVRGECRKAQAWLQANPLKRKTAAGMPRFLVNWLNRTTDSGRITPVGAPRPTSPVAEELQQLCDRAGITNYHQRLWFAGATLEHRGDCLVITVLDADARAFIEKHYLELLAHAAGVPTRIHQRAA